MEDLISKALEPVALVVVLAILALIAVALRAGAKGIRKFVKRTPNKIDDIALEPVADAMEDLADAATKKEDRKE